MLPHTAASDWRQATYHGTIVIFIFHFFQFSTFHFCFACFVFCAAHYVRQLARVQLLCAVRCAWCVLAALVALLFTNYSQNTRSRSCPPESSSCAYRAPCSCTVHCALRTAGSGQLLLPTTHHSVKLPNCHCPAKHQPAPAPVTSHSHAATVIVPPSPRRHRHFGSIHHLPWAAVGGREACDVTGTIVIHAG